MFKSVNLEELATIAQSVITPDVVSGSRAWKLTDQSRHKLQLAMFPRGKPDFDVEDTVPDEGDVVSQFTTSVAGPIIELLPPPTAAFAVLMLYEEFVKAVFIQPVLETEIGGEG